MKLENKLLLKCFINKTKVRKKLDYIYILGSQRKKYIIVESTHTSPLLKVFKKICLI